MKEKLRAAIIDSCLYVPEEIITNQSFEGLKLRDNNTGELTLETSDEWITKRTGVKERRKSAPDEYSSDMAIKAAQQMFENSSIRPTDLDGIIVATSTPDRIFPSTANIVQRALGTRTDIFAYDLGSACAAFLEAVDDARCRIESGNSKYVLVLAAETLTKIMDWTSPNCPIFGDGAGGFLLGPNVEGKGIMAVYRKNNPFDESEPYDRLFKIYKGVGDWESPRREKIEPGDGFDKGTLRMPNGPQVMKTAIQDMGKAIEEVVRMAGWKLSEVDLANCHQANIRITQGLKRKFRKFPNIHIYNNIYKYGNMSSVTCPACYHESRNEGLIKDGTKSVLVAYGSPDKTYAIANQS